MVRHSVAVFFGVLHPAQHVPSVGRLAPEELGALDLELGALDLELELP
jgi:hypothetical protein